MAEARPVQLAEGTSIPEIHWVDVEELFTGRAKVLDSLCQDIVILRGQKYSRQVAQRLCAAYGIADAKNLEVNAATESAAADLLRNRAVSESRVILAVGGGRVQDMAKYIASRSDKKLIVLPTLVATDGVASPVSVLRNAEGYSISHGAKAPDHVVLCWSLLEPVPLKYWKALAGDVLGNLVAVRDYRSFAQLGEGAKADLSVGRQCEQAEETAQRILNYPGPDFADGSFRMMLVESAIQSSFVMIAAGTSQPCSGSEHLLSHAIDHLQIPPGWLHGEQVGAAVPFCLLLHGEKALRSEVLRLYRKLEMVTSLQALGPEVEQRLDQILELAPDMRVGRRTVLDQYSTSELLSRITTE